MQYAADKYVEVQTARIEGQLDVQAASIEFLLYLSISLVLSGLFIATMSVAWRGANTEAYVDGFKKFSSTQALNDDEPSEAGKS